MSAEKKVFFLFILFVILNVACVYKYTNGFGFSPKVTQSTENEQLVQDKEEPINEPTNNQEIQETNPVVEPEKVIEEKKELIESYKPQIKIEIEEKKVEEVVEKIEPLLTTDKRYIRENNQKYIEDMSIETQKLQLEINEFVKNNPIIFKRGSNTITKKSNSTVKRIAKILKEQTNIIIEVAGHTDAAGPEKLNLDISVLRASSVKKRLMYYGINKSRIVARGYGEMIPFVKNSKQGYSIVNRRVEFNILEE